MDVEASVALEQRELALLCTHELARLLSVKRIESSKLGSARKLARQLVEVLEVPVPLGLHRVTAVRDVHQARHRGDEHEPDRVGLDHQHADDAEARHAQPR